MSIDKNPYVSLDIWLYLFIFNCSFSTFKNDKKRKSVHVYHLSTIQYYSWYA